MQWGHPEQSKTNLTLSYVFVSDPSATEEDRAKVVPAGHLEGLVEAPGIQEERKRENLIIFQVSFLLAPNIVIDNVYRELYFRRLLRISGAPLPAVPGCEGEPEDNSFIFSIRCVPIMLVILGSGWAASGL